MDKASVHDSLTHLRVFRANWDGYGAAPPDPAILDAIACIIDSVPSDAAPTPQVVPMTRGRVQLEWHGGARSLELGFETAGRIRYLKLDRGQGIEKEDLFGADDVSEIISLLHWFAVA